MRTMQLQQANGAAQVAKRDQLFAENPDPLRKVAEFVGEADRLPEAAQIFAARRAGADMGEFGVLLGTSRWK